MIQNLESTLRAGSVPQAPQFRPSAVVSSNQVAAAASKSVNGGTGQSTKTKDEDVAMKPNSELTRDVPEQTKIKTVSSSSGAGDAVAEDPLGDARNKVQEEISSEFAAIMATGTLRASEAAALATRRVMQRHGHMSTAQS